jgi:hypothetical protein
VTDRESFRTLIVESQHEAEAALVRGDVRPRLEMWSHRDPVSLFAAVGPSKTGWDEAGANLPRSSGPPLRRA